MESSTVLLAWYGLWSLITLLVYAKDKHAAQKGLWRVPERRLHSLSLVGGWPGALIAHRVIRHKNRKLSFQLMFWLTVFVNVGTLAALLAFLSQRTWL